MDCQITLLNVRFTMRLMQGRKSVGLLSESGFKEFRLNNMFGESYIYGWLQQSFQIHNP